MTSIEHNVAAHYERPNLESTILATLRAAGKDVERLSTTDLSGADEFHLGWRAATVTLMAELAPEPGVRWLDVGAGLGGPARYVAETCGACVTGIDLTPAYVETATALTRRCGLEGRVALRQGSALALPFEPGSFDGAYLIHVGMNIADKATLFREVRRVLAPGTRFAAYDIMRAGPGEVPYPMPWAESAGTSFLSTPDDYRQLLTASGFAVETTTDRREFVLRLWSEASAQAPLQGPPPLSLHALMESATTERLGNIRAAVEAAVLAPVQIIARAV